MCVITSDHGEALGEHDYLGHGELHEPILQVPLVMHGPGVPNDRITARVNLVGLYRTIAARIGPVPDHLRGVDLLGEAYQDDVFCQNYTNTWDWSRYGDNSDEGEHAYYQDGYKFIRRPAERILYNVVDDPGETTNLANRRQTLVTEMANRYGDILSSLPDADPSGDTSIDSDTEQRLEDLGYLE